MHKLILISVTERIIQAFMSSQNRHGAVHANIKIIFEKLVGFIVEHIRKVLNKLSLHSHCSYPYKWNK